jgi:predicted DsbA family dithiol-disulfide isomerase
MHRQFIVCLIALIATTACAQESDGGEAEIVARFGDQVITAAELEDHSEVRSQLIAIRQQEYEVKRRYLEQMIFERMVEQAAEREGLSREEYLTKHITDRTPEPDEQQVSGMMTQYRSRLDPDPVKARQQVVAALKQQSGQQIQVQLRDRLFQEAGVSILLEPTRFEAAVAEYHPSRGGERDAPVTLIEYTDFQCPYCRRVQPTLDEIMRRYDDKVRHVFKQLPLAMHTEAELAAEASLCASVQGKFWQLRDWLFANSKRINRDTLVEQARALDMDEPTFSACLDGRTYAAQVRQDMVEAQAFGISGTPGFLINGRVIRGAQPLDQFLDVINDELRRAGIEVPTATEATTEQAPTS